MTPSRAHGPWDATPNTAAAASPRRNPAPIRAPQASRWRQASCPRKRGRLSPRGLPQNLRRVRESRWRIPTRSDLAGKVSSTICMHSAEMDGVAVRVGRPRAAGRAESGRQAPPRPISAQSQPGIRTHPIVAGRSKRRGGSSRSMRVPELAAVGPQTPRCARARRVAMARRYSNHKAGETRSVPPRQGRHPGYDGPNLPDGGWAIQLRARGGRTPA